MPIEYLPENVGVSASVAYAEAVASGTVGDPILLTLEFRHPDFVDENGEPTSGWVVNDVRNLVATDELGNTRTFIGIPFDYVPPEQTDSGAPKPAALQLDNCSMELTRLLLLAVGSDEVIEVVERRYLPSDTSAPHVLPVNVMEASEPVVTVESVTVQLTFGNLTNRKFPARIYTAENFPTLAP